MTHGEIQAIKSQFQWASDNWPLFKNILRTLSASCDSLEPQDFLEAFHSLRAAGLTESAAMLLILQSETFPLYDFLEEAAMRCIAQNAEEFVPRIFERAVMDAENSARTADSWEIKEPETPSVPGS